MRFGLVKTTKAEVEINGRGGMHLGRQTAHIFAVSLTCLEMVNALMWPYQALVTFIVVWLQYLSIAYFYSPSASTDGELVRVGYRGVGFMSAAMLNSQLAIFWALARPMDSPQALVMYAFIMFQLRNIAISFILFASCRIVMPRWVYLRVSR